MNDILALYSLTFSRIAIGIIFTASSLGKLRDFSAFIKAVENFQILPRQFISASAYIFLGGEIVVVALVIFGNKTLLMAGFITAIFFLSVFCVALLTVLIRRLRVPCNCFGSSQRPVSTAEVWRNISFIICAFGGVVSLSALSDTTTRIKPVETGLLGMMAVVFVVLSVYLGEVMEVFRAS